MPQRIVKFYLGKKALEMIDRIAREKGLSRSEVFRSIIESYVKRKRRSK